MQIYDNSPNLIINSQMEIAQRSTGPINMSGTPAYLGIDRWQAWFTNTMSGTPTSNRSGLPTLGGPSKALYTNDIQNIPTNAASAVNISQKIEASMLLASPQNKFSLSFWAHVTNYTACEIIVSTANVVNTFTSITTAATQTIPTNLGGWKFFTLENITLANYNGVSIQITMKSPQTLSVASPVYITEVTFAPGSTRSVHKLAGRNSIEELALCRRYYEKSYNIENAPGTIVLNGAHGWHGQGSSNRPATSIYFRVEKYTTPTMTYYNPVTGLTVTPIRDTDASSNYGINSGVQSVRVVTVNPTATPPASAILYVHWTADGEIP